MFACTECGAQSPRWLGRCPSCGGWSTLVEEVRGGVGEHAASAAPLGLVGDGNGPIALGDVVAVEVPRIGTGLGELDRVLGGGLVPGSVVLLGGEPGIGKSTLALQLAAEVQRAGRPVLYVTGEESPQQIRLRAQRLPEVPADLLLLAETRVEALAEPWQKIDPALVVVDSIQTLRTDRVESAAGSVAQVRECAALLAAAAKASGAALCLIGHVTKEGALAGPRVLEHLVDAVLTFEGDRGHPYRILRAAKNRFGSTEELGVFTMSERGLDAVANPSELFLSERRAGAPGSCITPMLEGTRPLLLEIQALLAPAGYGTARRTALGFDDGRLALLLAVLERRGGVDVLGCDVYLNVTGGVRIAEPAADLAVVLALASSRLDLALPADVVALGEVGLGGELRRVGRLEPRLAEAARLGFRRALIPAGLTGSAGRSPLECVPIAEVAAAMDWLRASEKR